jgi:hypothetical protein
MMTFRRRRKILAIGIFGLVFLLFAICIKKWGIFGEDAALLLKVSKNRTTKGLFSYFFDANVRKISYLVSANTDTSFFEKESFFHALYRPLSLVFTTIEYMLFGPKAYHFFLVSIFLHAVNCTLLLWNLSYCVSLFVAVGSTIFFAFHPTLHDWIGKVDMQQCLLNTTLLLLVFFFIKKYLDSKNNIFEYLAWAVFGMSLGVRETGLVLPFVLFFGYPVYSKYIGLTFKGWLRLILGFFSVDFIYFLLRAYMHPIDFTEFFCPSSMNLLSFLWSRVLNRWQELKFFSYDVLGFFNYDFVSFFGFPCDCSLHDNYPRIIIMSLFLGLLIFKFIKSPQKRMICFLLLTMLIFSWPCLLYYTQRFFYEASIFYIAALALLVEFSPARFVIVSILEKIIGCILICACMFYVLSKVNARAEFYAELDNSVKQLKRDHGQLAYYPLGFVNFSAVGGPGVAHAVKLEFGGNQPVYDFGNIMIGPRNAELVSDLKVFLLEKGFRFKSLCRSKLWFTCYICTEENPHSQGDIVINDKDSNGRVFDFSLFLPEKYFDKSLKFISWDCKNRRLLVLN